MAYVNGYGYGGSPYWQFIDANGNPLSNGTVSTYIAGTTTAYNTLKDWNGTYNGVTFALDIRGGCSMIWPTTQLIKIIVKDVDGNLFKTLDNIGSGTAEYPITVFPDVSDNKNIWYLDTTNGLDSNSGLSRSAPKKTGDAVVIACKTAGKTTGRLVVMACSSGVVFSSMHWVDAKIPFFDVVCESFNTDIVWNAVNSSVRLQLIGGAHRFNGCNLSGSISMKCRTVVACGGDWNGEININAGDIFVDGLRCWGMSFFVTPFMHVQSTFMLGGEALIQALKINGAGSIYSYNNEAIKLEIQSTKFELKGQLSFPSQQGFSSFKISTMSMQRSATTSLLYLGAYTGVTVNYQIIVDTMGSIVPMEIANPAGTVAGKVIEFLKYENKVDAEIIRATAAEALKADLVGGKVPTAQLPSNDSKVEYVTQNCSDEVTEFAPVIQPNSYTTLTNIHSAITSLVIHCAALVDTKYAYIYQCKFTTPATLAITTFSILDADGVAVTWMGSAPSLKANKTYEISVVNGCAVIGVSV